MKKRDLPKAYDAQVHEDALYSAWESSGKFNPDNYAVDENSGTFTIMMPPPNATGILHLGHASMLAYQDVMVRYNRMLGKRTLWLPGTDHASIATQTKVEKVLLEEEGKTRHQLGREAFLDRVDAFVESSRNTIRTQMKKMGSSCDWSRERFTLDEGLSESVREIFMRMYHDDIMYRGYRVVNWCPRCQSTLADDEVEHTTGSAKLYTFKYGHDFPFAISTTRPETKLADTAVAVHPSDERYAQYIGKTFEVPFAGGVTLTLRVIGDHHVDKDFGTGALGVTPAHSMVDYQMAQQHGLPMITLIDQDGRITEQGGEYQGLTTVEARKKIAQWLRDEGLMLEEQDVAQSLSICYRCDHAIEPLPSLQWFVRVDAPITFPDGKKETLKERALRVVREGQIKIIPERFEKTYFDWMENLHDWCVSRQIWYGHRIPVWYRPSQQGGDEVYVGTVAPEGSGWTQDPDTLDTWFSSGQWTFATLGWPKAVKQDTVAERYEEKNDFERFHPTDVLETGYDIVFFWVARMILMTTYATGEIPFKTVYLHGMVRDEQGRKMSKSLGNSIDPLEIIPQYGTDALRMSMIIGSAPGQDLKLSEKKIEGYRNFVNKLYNIARFIIDPLEEVYRVQERPEAQTLADQWILNELDKVTLEVTAKLEKYQFSLAGEVLRDFTWNVLADWYIEITKIESVDAPESKTDMLLYILERVLKLWHPFMPFVTEHIWTFFNQDEFLMTQRWPQVVETEITEVPFDRIMQAVSHIRTMRGENKLDPALKLNALIVSQYDKQFKEQEAIIKRLARLEELTVVESLDARPAQSAVAVFGEGDMVYLLLEGLIDVEKEKARLEKEIDATYRVAETASKKLDTRSFVQGAPQEIVEQVKEAYAQAQDRLEKLKTQLESLQ